MNIVYHCGQCGQKIVIDENQAGMEAQCPNCHHLDRVPEKIERPKIKLKTVGDGYLLEPSPQPQPKERTCPKCGAGMEADACICVNCGLDLRTGKTVGEKQPRRLPWKQLVVSAVAVCMIIFCFLRIWAYWHGKQKPWNALTALHTLCAGTGAPAVGDGTIVDCELFATPTMCPPNEARIGKVMSVRNNGKLEFRRSGDTNLTIQPPTQSAIEVRVGIEVASSNAAPVLWPKAAAVQLVRSTESNCNYKIIQQLSEPQLATLRGRDGRHHSFYFLDSDIRPGTRYYYYLRFVREKKSILKRTGHCSAIALALPDLNVTKDKLGKVHLSWDNLSWLPSPLVGAPAIVVEHRDVHLLVWRAARAGEYSCPFTTNSVYGSSLTLDFGLDATVEQDTWSAKSGQEHGVARVHLRREIASPPVVRPAFPRSIAEPEAIEWVSPRDGTGILNIRTGGGTAGESQSMARSRGMALSRGRNV